MSFRDTLLSDPTAIDFFILMRHLERTASGPRLGEHLSRAAEPIRLGQDPELAFPASTLAAARVSEHGHLDVRVRFLGLLGAQGALPVAVTEEAIDFARTRDDALPRFLDIVNHPFLIAFYRAWADARPIAGHDRPHEDRFADFVGSSVGLGSTPFHGRDSVPDAAKLTIAGLVAPQTRGASRLRDAVVALFGLPAEITEFVGERLVLDPAQTTRLGARHATLGTDAMAGSTCLTVQDKFRLRLYASDMATYRRLLPEGDLATPLADLVFFLFGDQFVWEVEIALPAGKVEPVRVGATGQLGWTTWMAPDWADTDTTWRCDARFHPAERLRRRRAEARSAAGQGGP